MKPPESLAHQRKPAPGRWRDSGYFGQFPGALARALPSPKRIFSVVGVLVFAAQASLAQQNTSPNLSQPEEDHIIRTFAEKEAQFRRALLEYSFKRDAIFQTLGMGGQITGEYHRVSDFTFDDLGNRHEKIKYFPMPSIG